MTILVGVLLCLEHFLFLRPVFESLFASSVSIDTLSFVVGRIMILKDVHILIPASYHNVTSRGKGDFGNMIKDDDLELERVA